jgi:hypothetical protein
MPKLTNWMKRLFVKIVANLTPHCHDVTRLLSQSLERPLPLRTRLLLRLHFSICVWCSRYAKHLESLRKFSAEFPEKGCADEPGALPPAARERLKQSLQENRSG